MTNTSTSTTVVIWAIPRQVIYSLHKNWAFLCPSDFIWMCYDLIILHEATLKFCDISQNEIQAVS